MAIIRMLAFEQQPGGQHPTKQSINDTTKSDDLTVSSQNNSAQVSQNDNGAKQDDEVGQNNHLQYAGNGTDSTKAVNAAVMPVEENQKTKVVEPVNHINAKDLTSDSWPDVFKQMKLKGMARELARNMELLENQQKVITFAVDEAAKNFMTPKAQHAIGTELLAASPDYTLKFTLKNEAETLARKTAQQQAQQQEAKIQNVDPVVADLQQQFGATIIQNKLGD